MLPKPAGGAKPSVGDVRRLRDIETLSKALSLDQKKPPLIKPKKPPPSRSASAPKSHPNSIQSPRVPNRKERDDGDGGGIKAKKPSFWSSFNPIKSLRSAGRRFDVRFSLHVHAVDGLPPSFPAPALAVTWRRAADPQPAALSTSAAKVLGGGAEFDEILTHSCSVTARSGAKGAANYEAKQFAISVVVVGGQDLDLGRNLIDLTRLLPLSLEELDAEETSSGKWSTSFRLAGKAKGASLNVSFGFSIDRGAAGDEKKVAKVGSFASARDRSRSMDDVKVLHEVPPSARSDVSSLDDRKVEDFEEDDDMKNTRASEGHEVKEVKEPEFTVIEQGVETAEEDRIGTPGSEKVELGATRSNSLSLDEETVANEFLSMLGLDHSPGGLSSESDTESPRGQLWRQFKDESLRCGSDLFGGIGDGAEEEPNWMDGDFAEDFDLSSIIAEAELELQRATQASDGKSRAKMVEDAETEALMREWGINEKAFHSSPPSSRSGFGSPIDKTLEEPFELPPLGESLGSFVQTKDGGFLRSMSPALFQNAKNGGSLIMQVSSPVVVPAEMGSGIMDILQGLASIGVEKLSMQAKKLMPLEEVTGRTMQQLEWEAAPALESCERMDMQQHLEAKLEASINRVPSRRCKKSRSSNRETSSEYVSLEDLAPLAMGKIEALSIEGLRIQSGMSNEDAPSNISPQSIGDISALEGRQVINSKSLGLEGTGGLQLLDVKDSGDDVDGLMGLSITLDEWMKLDAGIIDEEDGVSDQTSKILAAHHARSTEMISGGGKRARRRWGLLGNTFTVALMVQLRDPLRNYEPVGAPMLSLIQVERVFVPPKPKIYSTVSEKGNSEEQDDDECEATTKPVSEEEKKKEEVDVVSQFKITEVHVAGIKPEPVRRKCWGSPAQQQSGSRWLLASGMGKSSKSSFMKSKAVSKPSPVTTTVQPGDTLWSISLRVHGNGAKWKELLALNPHIRNPNVIFPNETIRLK